MLVQGFATAGLAIFWVTIMMTVGLYVCAIVLVKTVGRGEDAFLRERFGAIPTAMLTLFELMSNPDLGPYRYTFSTHKSLMCFFIVFIVFGSFGMLAVITGIISESMMEKAGLAKIDEQEEWKKRQTLQEQ